MTETITIRLNKDVKLKDLHAWASDNNRSMNGQVVEELRKAIRKHTPSKANLPTPGDK